MKRNCYSKCAVRQMLWKCQYSFGNRYIQYLHIFSSGFNQAIRPKNVANRISSYVPYVYFRNYNFRQRFWKMFCGWALHIVVVKIEPECCCLWAEVEVSLSSYSLMNITQHYFKGFGFRFDFI